MSFLEPANDGDARPAIGFHAVRKVEDHGLDQYITFIESQSTFVEFLVAVVTTVVGNGPALKVVVLFGDNDRV